MAELLPPIRQRFYDQNGVPLAAGKLYSYEAGTSTPKVTYTTRAGDTPNTNPIILDSEGYADLWIASGVYKFVLADTDDNILWTRDQVALANEAALASAFWRGVINIDNTDSPYTITQDQNGYLINADTTAGSVVVNLPEIAEVILPYNVGVKKVAAANTVTVNRTGTDTIDGATTKLLETQNAAAQFIASIDDSPDDWTSIDIGTVADGSVTTLKIAAGAVTRAKLANGAVARKNVRSVVTTDTATNDDDVLLLSAASFVLTLPTAVGNKGKEFEIIHKGTNLTQVYTLATAGGTIGGVASGSYKMFTNGESLRVVSNDVDYDIIDHKTDTQWIDAGAFANFYTFTITAGNATLGATYTNNGITYTVAKTIAAGLSLIATGSGNPLTSGTLTKSAGTGDATLTFSAYTGSAYNISATTTAPVLSGAFTTNTYKWRRNGKFATIWAQFYWVAASGAGLVGSGDYIWPTIPNIPIDTAIYPVFTGGVVQSINSQTAASLAAMFPMIGGRAFISGGQWCASSWAPYSSTSYRVYGTASNTDGEYSLGSSYAQASNTGGSYQWQIEIPVSEWQP